LATHDLEAGYLGTALGQDIYTTAQRAQRSTTTTSHTINAVRSLGSIPAFVESGAVKEMVSSVSASARVPFVLVGSVRDDGPLPEVYGNVYEGQDAMARPGAQGHHLHLHGFHLHTVATAT
jgi:hypothetical protein